MVKGIRTEFESVTWIGSERRLARFIGRPVARFLHVEAAGGILLLIATAAALIWVNVASGSFERFWSTEISFVFGDFELSEHLLDWVNDGLMTVFFFVVGLEIKREMVTGQLRDRRAAMFPVIAALGGMVVPAGIYLSLNLGGVGESGWGIPMATDIAFALGIVALLGSRVPSALKIFLLTLAIADDIGAIVVIAIFYTSDLSFAWLALAAALFGLMVIMNKAGVRYVPAYVAVDVFVWLATFESGVHATIAGVAMGLLAPAKPLMAAVEAERVVDTLERREDVSVAEVRDAGFLIRESVSVAERLEEMLHPWSSYLIVPFFALGNAGILFTRDAVEDAITSTVTIGVLLGLVVGKIVGVGGFAWAAHRLRLVTLPPGVRGAHMFGIAAIAGVGFTVSLFITGLAFDDVVLQDEAKTGILVASVLAAIIGAAVLYRAGCDVPPDPELEPSMVADPLTSDD